MYCMREHLYVQFRASSFHPEVEKLLYRYAFNAIGSLPVNCSSRSFREAEHPYGPFRGQIKLRVS